MNKGEPTHLCPICISVEMQFVERLKTDKHYRLRRFKCPVCDHAEMYIMGGPDDAELQYKQRAAIKEQKIIQAANEFRDYKTL